MKNFTSKPLLVAFLLLISSHVFGQRSNTAPEIKSSTINFSDIIQYDIDHPDTLQQKLPNNPKKKILPVYDVPVNEKPIEDPFGRMDTTSINPSGAGSSSAPIITFNGLEDNGTSIPPDVNGAVGPTHIMTTLNTQVRIQNLTGTTISTVSLDNFWASVGNPNAFDPKILYEPYNNRWIFTACANSSSANSALLIGVSATNNPTGTWKLYSIDADATNTNWFDYPMIGYNKDWIVVTGNMFPNAGGSFVQTKLYVFKKSDLYAQVASPQFTLLTSTGFTLSPATTFDNSLSTLYLLQRWNGNSGGSGFIRLYTITGAIGSETLSSGVLISTPNPWSGSPPTENFAPQSGTTNKIALNDDRMGNTVYRNGSIWSSHTVFLPAGGVTRSAVQWWQLSTSGSIQQRGRIDDPSGASMFGFPSIAVNTSNDALIGYSKFSTTTFASSCYAVRASTDPVNTFQPEFLYKAGQAPYFKTFSGTRNRWGDYTATMTDPEGTDFWTIQQYASSPTSSDRWGTWWAKVAAPCVHNNVSISITASPSGPVCFGTRVTFTATSTGEGSAPIYQWKKNGTVVGTNSTTYSDIPGNGITYNCTLQSDLGCTTGNPATSNSITMSIPSINDGNACTTDACNTTTGAATHNPVNTNDGNACTTDACNTSTGAITHTSVSTSDGNACTTDACNSSTGAITHTPVNTDDNNECTTDACNTSSGAVTHNPINVDDGNACTVDGCDSSSGVFHNAVSIDDGNLCTSDGCNTSSGVFHNPVNADDNNACTTDGCDSVSGIYHDPVSTDDGDACTTDDCNTSSGAITHTSVSTSDGNACTTDACNTSTGAITHSQVNVDDNNECTTDGCNTSSGVFHNPVNADDNNACTTDGCDSVTGIYNNEINVDDGDACTVDACNTTSGIISHDPVITDDNDICTTDACDSTSGIITHDQVNVDDGDACTTDGCNSVSGVFHVPHCGVTLHSTILIQGFYTGGGLMDNNGIGGNLFVTGYSTDPSDADSITISVMNAASPYGLVDEQTVILKTNGELTVNFGASVIAGNSYYLRIIHRNSVETWSSIPVLMNTITSYSFVINVTQAYGSNQALTVDNLYAAIYSGDINHDGAIDGADFLELDPFIQNGDGGYVIGDLNGDGAVDGADFLVLDPNIQVGVGASIPTP